MWNFQADIFKTYNDSPPIMTIYSYEGIYILNDPAHPSGGSLNYVDINGVTQSKTMMWSGTCISFSSQSVPTNIVGAAICVPTASYSFNVIDGRSGCAAGSVNFTTIGGAITVYSIYNTLQDNATLYLDSERTILSTSESIKDGDKVYDLLNGVINAFMTIGNAC